MKYQDKLSKANLVLSYFEKGKSQKETIDYLKTIGLSKNDVSSVMLTSRNLFYDKYFIQSKYDIENLKVSELKNSDSEWLSIFDQHVLRKHKDKEVAKFNELLDKNVTKQEIESIIDTNTISKETIDQKTRDIELLEKKRNREGYIGIIGGLGFLMFYEFTILKSKPLNFFLIMGLYFIARGAYLLFKNKRK